MEFNATRVYSFLSSPVKANYAKHKHSFTGQCSTTNTRSFLRHCHHQLQHLVPVCHSASSSLSFPSSCCTQFLPLVRLTSRHRPWASLPLIAGVAAPPARAPAMRRAVCPHVGHGPQPTLEAPRGGLRQGDVRGGAGRKLSRPPLRNQMLRGFPRYPARTFYGSLERTRRLTHGSQNSESTITNYKVHHNRIYNHIQ